VESQRTGTTAGEIKALLIRSWLWRRLQKLLATRLSSEPDSVRTVHRHRGFKSSVILTGFSRLRVAGRENAEKTKNVLVVTTHV
jgi:hypothetical protein